MKISLLLLLLAIFTYPTVSAQTAVYPLYPDGSVQEIADGGKWEPEVHFYVPEAPNGKAVLICPGGGYGGLSFGILMYPVISMMPGITHGGSSFNLIGRTPDEGTRQAYSANLNVNENTPPTLLIHCSDDPAVPPENSILFYRALLDSKVQSELHIFQEGGHGWGIANGKFPYYDELYSIMERWIKEH